MSHLPPHTNDPALKVPPGQGSHRRLALICALAAVAMFGASFAAVPLYRLFCQVTGYGGTTQRALKPSLTEGERTVTIRFDANVRNIPWLFKPERETTTVRVGETVLAFFRATNTAREPVTGSAVFNVTPEIVGGYFNKIQCFCFTEQTLAPGETVEMPVTFYVDPAIENDKDARRIGEITLSYTFFPVAAKSAARQVSGMAQVSSPRGRGW